MEARFRWLCSLWVLGVLGGSAGAQPQDPAPPAVGYPAALTERPLLLPANAFEVTGAGRLAVQDFDEDRAESVDGLAGFRYGLAGAELEVGVDVRARQGSPEGLEATNDDPVRRLFAAGRFALGDELALGAELAVHFPTAPYLIYSPRLVLANKQHFGRGAVELSLASGIDHAPGKSESTIAYASFNNLVLGG